MTTRLTDDPAVQQLAKIFDLEFPKGHRMVVTDWAFVDGKIEFGKVDVYDTDGKFVKEADLSKLKDSMHQFSFVFKKQSE